MARLLGRLLADCVEDARTFARERNVCLVLKGHRTLVALPDGSVYINLSGSPSMAKAGSGDILTGMIAGIVAQFPGGDWVAVRAAVWMHGRSGEMAAEEWTDKCVIATDLLQYSCRGRFGRSRKNQGSRIVRFSQSTLSQLSTFSVPSNSLA